MEPKFLELIYEIYAKRKEEIAKQYLRRILQGKNNIVVTISGKDSLVAAHLFSQIRSVEMQVMFIINRYVGRRELPNSVIEELYGIVVKLFDFGNIIITDFQWNAHSNLFVQIVRHYSCVDAIITGLREQEDGTWPDAVYSPNRRPVAIVAPLRYWRHTDVWSYIYRHSIPIVSAYHGAMPWESLQHRVLT